MFPISWIIMARQADDPSLEQGAWVTSLKEADWKFVATGCAKASPSPTRPCDSD